MFATDIVAHAPVSRVSCLHKYVTLGLHYLANVFVVRMRKDGYNHHVAFAV